MSVSIWENTLIRISFTSYYFMWFDLMTTDVAARGGRFKNSE